MISSSRAQEADSGAPRESRSLVADICVVGAGPAGITVALAAARRGVRVCLVETGGGAPDRAGKALARGRSTGHPYPPLDAVRSRAFGGTSHLWDLQTGWLARPLDREDFADRPGVEGWPFPSSELTSHYARAHDVCGLPSDRYDPAEWSQRSPHATLPLDPTQVRTLVFQYGHTGFGSRQRELESLEVCTTLRGTVVELQCGPRAASISGAVVVTAQGPVTIRADAVVLATGGIENARMLQLHARRRPESPISRDLLGRCFMERIALGSGVFVPADGAVLDELSFYRRHDVDGVTIRGTLQLSPEVRQAEELLNCAIFLDRPRPEAWASSGVQSLRALRVGMGRRPRPPHLTAHVRNVMRDRRAVAAMVTGRLGLADGLPDTVAAVVVQGEPSANPASRVSLGRRRDRFGLPLAQLDWRPGPRDRASVRRTQELISAYLRGAGIGRLHGWLGDEHPPAGIEGSHHHLGTTRMHEDPARGVVDAACRVHGLDNLYVAGSSVFPTAGCANPTLTIVALSLRLADQLTKSGGPADA